MIERLCKSMYSAQGVYFVISSTLLGFDRGRKRLQICLYAGKAVRFFFVTALRTLFDFACGGPRACRLCRLRNPNTSAYAPVMAAAALTAAAVLAAVMAAAVLAAVMAAAAAVWPAAAVTAAAAELAAAALTAVAAATLCAVCFVHPMACL